MQRHLLGAEDRPDAAGPAQVLPGSKRSKWKVQGSGFSAWAV